MNLVIILAFFPIERYDKVINLVANQLRDFNAGYNMKRDCLKNRLDHGEPASLEKIPLVPRVHFERQIFNY